jgi:hypothetical protein
MACIGVVSAADAAGWPPEIWRMKCASCATDNPQGARYCFNCGADQSVPTPVAAVASGMMPARSTGAQAANASEANPLRDAHAANAPRADAQAANAPHAPDDAVGTASAVRATVAPTREPLRWNGDPLPADGAFATRSAAQAAAGARTHGSGAAAAAPPAYSAQPHRRRLAVSLIAACIGVALLAFGGWRYLHTDRSAALDLTDHDPGESVMSSFPPDATPQRSRPRAAAPAPSPDDTRAAGVAAERGTTASINGVAPLPPQRQPPAASASPVEISPLPPKPARKSARAHSEPAHPPVVASDASRPAAPADAQPSTVPAAPLARAPATTVAPAAPRVGDRWAQQNAELARCTREDFIARVICGQRARFRHCDGYWGTVPQCPGNPAPERGQ